MKKILLIMLQILVSVEGFANEKLVIISPHRKSIQEEFIPKFEKYYLKNFNKKINVDWLDQGGSADDIRFLKAKYTKDPATSGIDVFWGGGSSTFMELLTAGLLVKTELPPELLQQIPKLVGGIPQYDESQTWYGTALSSFGIFYSKKMLRYLKLPEPSTWRDLGEFRYFNNILQTDPRRSGTATTLNNIILQSDGWEKGWEKLIRMGGNTNHFSHSSSDPIKGVVSSNAPIGLAIDFYALAKIASVGAQNLGFVLPKGETILDSDPIALLKGAPHATSAKRFIEWVLSTEAQQLLVLPKGAKGGPTKTTLGRMSVNSKVYSLTEGRRISAFNPFLEQKFLALDIHKVAITNRILGDLLGAMIIDTHKELKAAWKAINQSVERPQPESLKALAAMPLSEKEFTLLAAQWHDEVLRNKTINAWVDFARKKYKALAKNNSG